MENIKKQCPICGEQSLIEKTGDFHFEPPENIPGGTMIIPNSEWEECESCKEVILLPELIKNLDKQKNKRIVNKKDFTCPNCKGDKSIFVNDGHSKLTKISCPTCKGIGLFFTNQEKIKKIKEWQESDYVHQLTCSSGSCNHVVLIPIEENYKVILKCPECDYVQTFIPEAVLKIDMKQVEKNIKNFES